jgi:hypothetical protein
MYMNQYASSWRKLEERYEVNNYDSSGPDVLVIPGVKLPRLIFSAPHATNHIRDGKLKYADRGTGGLAELLAGELGATALIAATGRNGDANHDSRHVFKETLTSLSPSYIIDLHGMKDRPDHPVQIDLGTSQGLTPPGLESALRINLKTSTGALFTNGGKLTTVTSWAQLQGIPALQIEITASHRPPTGSDLDLKLLVSGFLTALRQVFEK